MWNNVKFTKKVAEAVQWGPKYPDPVSPHVTILSNHGAFVRTKKSTLVYSY